MQGQRADTAYRSIFDHFFGPRGTDFRFDHCRDEPGVASPSHLLATPATLPSNPLLHPDPAASATGGRLGAAASLPSMIVRD